MTDGELFQEASRRSGRREPYVLCTVTRTARSAPRDAGAKMLVAPDGSIAGTIGGGPLEAAVVHECRALLAGKGGSGERRFALTTAGDAAEPLPLDGPPLGEDLGMKCGGEVSVFLDVVRPAARLLVYGAGHVGERVANIAAEAGLATTVIDDREEFARPERFPKAAVVHAALEREPLGGQDPGAGDFVVILTRCHALDESVLEAALRTSARYIGLIGSRRKVALILRSIARRLGRDPREDPRLHAPIGLKLGDKTPGEIAISVLAEVILVKSQGELAHSRLPARDPVRAARP